MNATVYPSDPWAGVLEHLEEATSLNRESNKWTGSRLAQLLTEVTGTGYRWQISAAPAAPGRLYRCRTFRRTRHRYLVAGPDARLPGRAALADRDRVFQRYMRIERQTDQAGRSHIQTHASHVKTSQLWRHDSRGSYR
jgi:hypothetical protein